MHKLLEKIEKQPETEFTSQGFADVREIIAAPDSREDLLRQTAAAGEDVDDRILVRALIDLYETKTSRTELENKQREAENLLANAWQDRELASALIEHNWLGLNLLTTLNSGSPLKPSSLAALVGSHIDVAIPVLVRLIQFGGVREQDRLFAITERGSEIIKNLEVLPIEVYLPG